ncbi:MAG TPA: alpha/beta hydrolase, partial [Pseudorhodoplanes sp.]|nr:alpha/beta hydrolase [Pseudorhodoplanes sp.]
EKDEALIFVHGFKVGFLDAIYRCAQIAWDIRYEGIPVLYSWASRAKVLDYPYDQISARLAQPRFVALLLALRDAGISKVHILAHSMGNYAILDAIYHHPEHARHALGIGELLMAAPDVDADHYRDVASTVRAAVQGMTLYASSKDWAMTVSKTVAGRIPRAGEVSENGPILVDRIDAIDVTAVGDNVLGLNHGYYASENSILNDVKLLLERGIRPPSNRLAEILGMPEGQNPSKWWRYAR